MRTSMAGARSRQPAGGQPGAPKIHVHLFGAVPDGLTVEYMPRLFHLWKSVPEPVDGMLLMPTAPGLGLEFDQTAIDRYRA